MQKLPQIFTLLVALSGLIAGCHHAGHTARSKTPSTTPVVRNAFDRQQERTAYVDNHYKQLLKSGRFASEKDARIYAGYQWDRDEKHRSDAPVESVIWSSDQARKREQKQLESDLAKMYDH